MQKKILAILLVLLMAISTMACSTKLSSLTGGQETDIGASLSDYATDSAEKPAQSTTDQATDETPPQVSNDNQPAATEVTIAETVLVDQDGIKITAKSMAYEEYYGPAVKLSVENNSDKNITVSTDSVCVNGYMISGSMYTQVVAGKKANDTLRFYADTLKDYGIEQIAQMDIVFSIYDSDSYKTIFTPDEVCLTTSAFGTYTQSYDDSGDVLYEKDGIRIVYQGSRQDDYYGTTYRLYTENTSDKPVFVSMEDVSIDGYMVNALFMVKVPAGRVAVDYLEFSPSELEENDITEIKDIEFHFEISDGDTYRTINTSEILTIE